MHHGSHRLWSRLWHAVVALTTTAPCAGQSSVAGGELQKNVSGVSGARFSGAVVRDVSKDQLSFAGTKRSDLKAMRDPTQCERWIVVTSIFQPSPATRKLGEMTRQGWCYVVVADKNGPSEYDDVEGVIYLTVERQRQLHFQVVDHIPWRHFGRKNIGFLYAIAHGARVIYDTDDDNRLKESVIPILGIDPSNGRDLGEPVNVSQPVEESGKPRAFNPYPSFRPTCGHIWPRGFPLDEVQGHGAENWTLATRQLDRAPAVQQFLADADPDVDAVFRLTRQLPCSFQGLPPGSPPVLAIPPNIYTPYNAQATAHLREAFWSLLLPITVHGRVSDIWRAYLAQRLLWDIGQVVAFTPAHVIHDRVAHDYLKDFHSEQDLYLKATAMVSFLSCWVSDAPTLVERLEQLWAALYSRGFVEIGDLRLAQAWIRDLLALGYEFPDLQLGKIMWADATCGPNGCSATSTRTCQ